MGRKAPVAKPLKRQDGTGKFDNSTNPTQYLATSVSTHFWPSLVRSSSEDRFVSDDPTQHKIRTHCWDCEEHNWISMISQAPRGKDNVTHQNLDRDRKQSKSALTATEAKRGEVSGNDSQAQYGTNSKQL